MNFPHFIGGSVVSQSIIADQEYTMNMYVEQNESQGATFPLALYPVPGVQEISSVATGPGSGHYWDATTQREFAVVGLTFYEISQAGTFTSRGSVAAGTTPATICGNGAGGDQVMVTAGTNVYIFTLATNTFAQVASMNGKATMGAQLDGYFLVLDGTTATLYISNLLDGTTWDPTQFAQRTIAADPWVSMIVLNRYIYLLGSETSEVWYDTGAFPFPFAPHPSGLIPHGCAAPFSPRVVASTIVWVTRTINGQGSVVRTAGFNAEEISTPSLELALNSYSTLDDGIGDAFDDKGHVFYYLTLPTANVSWQWDATAPAGMAWTNLGTWIPSNGAYDRRRAFWHAFAFDQHRMLDLVTGSLYRVSSDYATDVDGMALRMVRRAPALQFENKRLYYPAFELLMEVGVGTETGQGANPLVSLRTSNDGGHTFGPERFANCGALGEYQRRVRWTRCGSARRRVFEVVVSDPIPWRIVGAALPDFISPERQ